MSVIKNLHLQIQDFSLSIDELSLSDHEVTAVIGPSGSGKSTFFKALIGLEKPQSNWSWKFKEILLSDLDISERRLGVVFQNYELFPHLTAQQNIEMVMKARNNFGSEAQEKKEYFKNKLNLTKCWTTSAHRLSGGEQQRVALLRAMLSLPRLILLDEPFSALDEKNKNEAYDLLQSVISEIEAPALLITHDMKEAQLFAKKMIYFDQGRVINKE